MASGSGGSYNRNKAPGGRGRGGRTYRLSSALQRRESYMAPSRTLRRQGAVNAIPSRWLA